MQIHHDQTVILLGDNDLLPLRVVELDKQQRYSSEDAENILELIDKTSFRFAAEQAFNIAHLAIYTGKYGTKILKTRYELPT